MNPNDLIKRGKCRLCNSANISAEISLPLTNVADKYGKAPYEIGHKYPLDIYQCRDCGHVQIVDILPLNYLFSSDYTYKPSNNPKLIAHFKKYAKRVGENLGHHPKKCLDIGSNDGLFLECLRDLYNAEVIGVDPADSAVKAAEKKSIKTLKRFFDDELASEFIKNNQLFDHISANNVFAHNDDLISFTKGLSKVLKAGGIFSFEISYLVDIVEKGLIGTIFHEHLSHHSLISLNKFLINYDLHLFDIDYVDTQGGAIIGYASKTIKKDHSKNLKEYFAKEKFLEVDKPSYMTKFRNNLINIKNTFNNILNANINSKSRIIIFGAARSANLLIEFLQLSNIIDCILDDNEEKVGKYLLNSNAKIISTNKFTSKEIDIIIPLAWIHSENIYQRLKKENYKGKFLTIYPKVEILDF